MNNKIENTILQVPIEDIIPNRFQPRLAFDDASLQDLASSIKQHGIIQPLVLRRKTISMKLSPEKEDIRQRN